MTERTGLVVLSGATVVRPDRIDSDASIVIDGDRIVDVVPGPGRFARGDAGAGDRHFRLDGQIVVPGFIDVHVHGAMGVDTLDGAGAVARLADHLPRWGVTAFCPTTVACGPAALEPFLAEVAALRIAPPAHAARVLPAHLESNFVNPEFRGAQPEGCLRRPSDAAAASLLPEDRSKSDPHAFAARDVLQIVDQHRADVGIFTMAPELEGGRDLLRALIASGMRVSIGHSAATFDQTQEAIAAGVRHATHLFNRMTPMTSREPGIVGAVLGSEDVAAEVICDGHHVHPATVHVAVASKGAARVMAITDGTAGSGLPRGTRAKLGRRTIVVDDVARLEDGTMAGSVSTMAQAFACLVTRCGVDLVQAAAMCATTPARELGLVGYGVIAPGMVADLTVLSARLEVVQTWIAGRQVWTSARRPL
ncbi:MAG TPA: N-acetylglucosamine-6-phosphate deacetylase [Vicinamibacterales bacterium]|nr:N-acetylglucosamine-6-phosphate deacetylase [Vicinamibacterales bacterium]